MQQLDISSYLGKLQDYYAQEKIIPSITELSALWNGKARSWTHQIVQRLKEEGFLENAPGGRLRPAPRFFERTVGHAVRAGMPQQAADVQPELLRIDDYLIENPSQTILFPVKGDSMIDLGILEGDMVIIERSNIIPSMPVKSYWQSWIMNSPSKSWPRIKEVITSKRATKAEARIIRPSGLNRNWKSMGCMLASSEKPICPDIASAPIVD